MKQKKQKQFRFELYFKTIAGFMLAIVFLFGGVIYLEFGSRNVVLADELSEKEIKEKKDDINDDIKDYEKKLEKEKKKKREKMQVANQTKRDIDQIVGNIINIKSQVNRTEEELNKLDKDLEKIENDIKSSKNQMARMVRKMNRQKVDLKMILLDSDRGLAEYINNRDVIESLQKDILKNLKELKEKRRELEKIKEEKVETKNKLASQKAGLEQEKTKKGWLLRQKNQEINQHEEKIKGIKRKIDKLNSTLSSFLGKSFNTNDIVKAIKFASKKTGVRKEFLMAMLDKETDLGRFTGGCTYKNTKVRDNDKKIFKEICKELGYNYKKKKISCALSYGYGGAMGVAQFMPSTWLGYKARISRYTGNSPANPWSLTDGVMGMAIKLKDAGADKKSGEYKAAAMYYCGGNWKRKVCKNYANTVKSWAKGGYEEYF